MHNGYGKRQTDASGFLLPSVIISTFQFLKFPKTIKKNRFPKHVFMNAKMKASNHNEFFFSNGI